MKHGHLSSRGGKVIKQILEKWPRIGYSGKLCCCWHLSLEPVIREGEWLDCLEVFTD